VDINPAQNFLTIHWAVAFK